eukprot:2017989-Karenia_brevis.AAC.1
MMFDSAVAIFCASAVQLSSNETLAFKHPVESSASKKARRSQFGSSHFGSRRMTLAMTCGEIKVKTWLMVKTHVLPSQSRTMKNHMTLLRQCVKTVPGRSTVDMAA